MWKHSKLNMKKLITSIALVLASITFASHSIAQMQWREATNEIKVSTTESKITSDGIEIFGKDGYIVVRLPQKAQVKVFTILGQLVSQAELNAGTSMLKVNSRGIYIVKVGNVTQKVAM